jgi:hypothetical protein
MQTFAEQQVMPRIRGEQPAALGQTGRQMFSDVARGAAAPYAGPPVNAAAALLSGKTALGYEGRQPGEQFPYFGAATRQLNPLLGAGMTDVPLTGFANKAKQLGGVSDSKEGTVIRNQARQFLYKIGKVKNLDFPPSEYLPLIDSLRVGDTAKAKEFYNKLVQEKEQQHQFGASPENEAKKTLDTYFKHYATRPVTGSKEDEKAFLAQLTPHQKELYDKMQEQNKAISDKFFTEVQPKMMKKGRLKSFSW